MFFLSLLALCFGAWPPVDQTTDMPATRERVQTTVAAAVRVLEAKDYRAFLSEFLPPEVIAARTSSPEWLDALVQQFSPRADGLLTALKFIVTPVPTLDEAGTTAIYRPAPAPTGDSRHHRTRAACRTDRCRRVQC